MKNSKERKDITYFHYTNVPLLLQFVNPHGRIVSRRRTGLTAKQQRDLTRAVKRSRIMGFMPFIMH